jgi:3-hydroxyacyl-[acyl-carrier-protein] dehydratase
MLTAAQIQEIIPHRYPFLLVDRILEMEGDRVVGLKQVSINEAHFQGHFPNYPIMPGVLIVESLAQTGAVLLLSDPENRGKLALFAGINNLRFRRPVVPGDTLRLEVQLTSRRSRIGTGAARALVDGQVVCDGELTFALVTNLNGAARATTQPAEGA